MVSGSAEYALPPNVYCKRMSECRRVLDISVLRLCNLHSRMPTPKKGNLGKKGPQTVPQCRKLLLQEPIFKTLRFSDHLVSDK
jgi:hypothetical protein